MQSGTRHLLRQSLLWLGTGLALCAAFYYADAITSLVPGSTGERVARQLSPTPDPLPSAGSFSRELRIPRGRGGHYEVDATVSGRTVPFMVDTGASLVVLTYQDASRIGLAPQSLEFSGRARTANGVSRIAMIEIPQIRIGSITLYNVSAAVAEPDALEMNLLGMSFLGQLSRFQIEDDELVLIR